MRCSLEQSSNRGLGGQLGEIVEDLILASSRYPLPEVTIRVEADNRRGEGVGIVGHEQMAFIQQAHAFSTNGRRNDRQPKTQGLADLAFMPAP